MKRRSLIRAAQISAVLLGGLLPAFSATAGNTVDDYSSSRTASAVLPPSQPESVAAKPYGQPTPPVIPQLERSADTSGMIASIRPDAVVTRTNPFFTTHRGNGRTCFTCHQPDQGWSVSAQNIRMRFRVSAGLDPIFRPIDGAVCPSSPIRTFAEKQSAYSLLLGRGLIRVSVWIPPQRAAGGQFDISRIDDPNGCGSSKRVATGPASFYRRPLPATNLRLLTTVMWDGRQGGLQAPISAPDRQPALVDDLRRQASDAMLSHLQAWPPPAVVRQIVDFELGNTTAQVSDNAAQALNAGGALGGPQVLSKQPFYVGINDPENQNPFLVDFTPAVFTRFGAWSGVTGNATAAAQAAIARGQAVFNTKPIRMTNVAGINDVQYRKVVSGFCGTCHDTPNAGNHSVDETFNIGIAGAGQDTPHGLNTAGLPVFTVTCRDATYFHPARTPFQVTDLGRAMASGQCADVGKFKVPTLRGLAARPPYFHNGSAATLMDVVEFYDGRFNIGFTRQEKSDLVAFLLSL